MGLFCTINNHARAVGTKANEVASSDTGKWAAIGLIVTTLITTVANSCNHFVDHREAVAHFQKLDHMNNVVHGSNFVSRVEAEVKK